MRLIKPSFEIIEQEPGLQGIYKQIELAGRTCYKSLDKITEDSAEDFVNRMIASKHYAMLEHGTVYLEWEPKSLVEPDGDKVYSPLRHYKHNPYSNFKIVYKQGSTPGKYDVPVTLVTTNFRVLVENEWLDDLQYLCEPTELHEKRVTVRFITDRGVSHEFVRHRVFSFAQESTRYCNYVKDKFDNEIVYIIPSWADLQEGSYNVQKSLALSNEPTGSRSLAVQLVLCESTYFFMINGLKLQPQQARQVLPNALKTELIMTGFVSDWNHFFDLRARGTTGKPHPDAKALAEPLMNEFINQNLL